MRGAVAAAIDQVERLAACWPARRAAGGSPTALVGDVHALLALARGRHHRAVGVDDRLARRTRRAAACHTRSRVSLIASIRISMSDSSKRRQKSPAVVGSGIRWAPKRVEIHLVVAAQLDVLQARAAAQRCCRRCSARGPTRGTAGGSSAREACDRSLRPARSAGPAGASPDPARIDAASPFRDFVVNVASSEHWFVLRFPLDVTQAVLDSTARIANCTLATTAVFCFASLHSKRSFCFQIVPLPLALKTM